MKSSETIDFTLPNVVLIIGKVYTIVARGKQYDKSANLGLKLISHNLNVFILHFKQFYSTVELFFLLLT